MLGQIKGEPASKDGLRGNKCSYDSVSGAWVKIEVYSADAHWELMKNITLNAQALTNLGEEALARSAMPPKKLRQPSRSGYP